MFGPPPARLGQAAGAGAADRIERWRSWLESFASALETGDLTAIDRLFAVETSYQAGPFSPLLRGRRSIRSYWETVLADRAGLAISAEALGVGATYAVAHWTLTWGTGGDSAARSGGESPTSSGRTADGMILAAFDPMGRCSSFREWTLTD